jgi:ketosteroid isomerase-like protein
VLAALQDLTWALASADGVALDTLLAGDLTVFRDGHLTQGASSVLRTNKAAEGEAAASRRLLFRDVSVEIADGQMAWATARYILQASDSEGASVERGLATLIFKRAEGVWRLAHMHLSASTQPGAPGAPDEAR